MKKTITDKELAQCLNNVKKFLIDLKGEENVSDEEVAKVTSFLLKEQGYE